MIEESRIVAAVAAYWEQWGYGPTVRELAEALETVGSNVQRRVKSMVARGLLEADYAPGGRVRTRSVRVPGRVPAHGAADKPEE